MAVHHRSSHLDRQGGHVKQAVVFAIAAQLIFSLGVARAERGDQAAVLSTRGTGGAPPGSLVPEGTPDSILSIAMGGRESWDTWNASSNEILSEILGAGSVVTGVGWRQLGIATVPKTGSWRWDAVTSLYSSHPASFFLDIAPGAGDGPGTGVYNSGGILDLGDFNISDLPIGDDGILTVQLWEDPDDVANAVDANYTGGNLDVAYVGGAPVPATPAVVLAGIALLLLGTGVSLIARKAARGSSATDI